MKKDSLYKVFAGQFSLLDENGENTDFYKNYDLFKNTYGLAFFINAATKGRCYVFYFARDNNGWNYRTVFPIGRLIESQNKICIKTRYNTFVWNVVDESQKAQIESVYEWVKENGEVYIPGLTNHIGVKEYFERGHHF